MVYRKGELTKAAIDRGWPHQVALPTPISFLWDIQDLRKGLSLCQRTMAFYRDGVHDACFCFAERSDAQKFQARARCGYGSQQHQRDF